MDQTVIRKAEPADGLGMAVVQAYTWKTTYTGILPEAELDCMIEQVPERAVRWKREIEQGALNFVAEQERTIIGFSGCGPSRDAGKAVGEIYGLYVLKPFQGCGIGRSLFTQCADALKEAGYESLLANCLVGNPALGFYEKMGGSVIGVRKDTRGGWIMQEQILKFQLDGAAR